ncbi:MAG: hypothetical protein JWM33_1429 [Caulobacteraceae bacterium]|nr:hypothetical protein [Caulobacteraceae bacterium]
MTDEQKRKMLAVYLNQSRCDWGCTSFTKSQLLASAQGDEVLLIKLLKAWEAKGLLEIDWEAFHKDDGLVVYMRDYIEANLPRLGPSSTLARERKAAQARADEAKAKLADANPATMPQSRTRP